MGPYVRIFLVLAGFGVFHSLSAREAFKDAILSKIRLSRPAYAMVRTSISLTLLILSLYFLFQQASSGASESARNSTTHNASAYRPRVQRMAAYEFGETGS